MVLQYSGPGLKMHFGDLSAGAKAGSAPQASSTSAPVMSPAPGASVLNSSLDLLGAPSSASAAAAPPQSDAAAPAAPSGAPRAESDDLLPISTRDEGKSISLSSWTEDSKAVQQKELLGGSAHQQPSPAEVCSSSSWHHVQVSMAVNVDHELPLRLHRRSPPGYAGEHHRS